MDINKANNNKPFWFVFLLVANILPIFLWPLIFFSSIFLFDAPGSHTSTWIVFILMNSYPLVLIGNCIFSYKTYTKNPRRSMLLLSGSLGVILFLTLYIIFM
ncbi:MAG: DUF5389 family protein [Bacteroidetes bacterium]|nr:DUF5389 family protein [Bacteroidota bacterium]